MAHVWVRAKTNILIEENGRNRAFYPGDWCQMGRHQAREYLKHDQVEILKTSVLKTVQDLTDCAILLRGEEINDQQRGLIAAKFPGVPVEGWQEGYPTQHGRFLLWDMAAPLRQDLILTGFSLLNKWQLAAPLLGYDMLAETLGSKAERAATLAVVHDLRVPVYNPKVIFCRQCAETRRLFELWDGVSELSLLRAIYQSRPLVNALPPSWVL